MPKRFGGNGMSDTLTYIKYDDYVQSANTLFHFVGEFKYLQSIITTKNIIPRYCIEDVSYLNLESDGVPVKEIAVLQKCFCDIPLHKLTSRFKVDLINEVPETIADFVDSELQKCNTHPGLYGQFGIGLSKTWGEQNNLQPIQYINERSSFAKCFSAMVSAALDSEDFPDYMADDILRRLSFMKPLRGSMKRTLSDSDRTEIVIQKNFHDECEWRYSPNTEQLTELNIGNVIANPNILSSGFCNEINKGISTEKYQSLWLKYHYDDLRYIIVPDSQARIDIINLIRDIPDENFNGSDNPERDRYVLASKILVLDSLRKDW